MSSWLTGVRAESLVSLACPHCGTEFSTVPGEVMDCPSCGRRVQARAFPALSEAATPFLSPQLAAGSDATCFFHPTVVADRPCEECGRFLCALCEIELNGRRYCPLCAQAGTQTSGPAAATEALRNQEFLYDSMVLWLGLLWVLIWPSWIVITPVCIYLTIRYWKAPQHSLLPRSRWRFAVGLAGLCMPVLLLLIFLAPVMR